MASAAAPTANLLQTCAALLMSPYCGMHSPNIEAVLVKIGLQSTRIGLKLIDILLRNCAASGTDPASESVHTAVLVFRALPVLGFVDRFQRFCGFGCPLVTF